MQMYLYKISRKDDCGYDEYDSAVVCAESRIKARFIHPSPYHYWKVEASGEGSWLFKRTNYSSWGDTGWVTPSARTIAVIYLGSTERKRPGVIVSSFNAG